jgi:thiamine-monophosphate kinase
LKASGVGALLDASQIPLTDTVRESNDAQLAVQRGLSDGEDFELLFIVAPDEARRLQQEWNSPTPITQIGVITHEPDCLIRNLDGQVVPLPPVGWTHSLGST